MNFENMPELQWEYGYFWILGVMAISAVGLVLFFRARKWF
jgi:magnesium transporter